VLRAKTRGRYLARVLALGLCGWAGMCGPASAQRPATASIPPPDLTTVPDSPFSTGGESSSSISYSPDGKFIAVASRQESGTSHGSLSMLSVSGTGALAVVEGSPFETTGGPNSLAFDPEGKFLVVANAETKLPDNSLCGACVSTYSVGTDGSLTPITGSIAGSNDYSAIEQIAFDPAGNVVVASTATELLSFSLADNGDLSLVGQASLPENGILSGGVAVSPDGKLVAVSDTGTNSVDLFSLSGGQLSYLSSESSGESPQGLAFSPNGEFLAAANANSNNVSLFSVGSTALVPEPGSPYTQPDDPDDGPTAVAFNQDGWLAIVNGDSYLTVHAITANDEVEEPGTTYGPIGLYPGSPIFSPSGQFLDIVDSYTNQTTGFSDVYVFAGLAPPTAKIRTPATGGTYDVGQVVPTSFTCADSTGAPGIASCTDSNGAAQGGGKLNTSAAGSHTYSVTAVSRDGLSATAKITYTVLPPAVGTAGPVTISGNTAKTTLGCLGASSQSCSITVSVTVQEALSGSKIVAVKALAGRAKPKRTVKTVVIGSVSVKLSGGTKRTVKLTLNSKGRALVTKRHSVPADVAVTQGKRLLRGQRVTFKQPKRKRG
jgi:DNA-binding beta-propeller fold protein YncE